MRTICFIQESKDADLTMRQQQLVCHRALRKLQWDCSLDAVSSGEADVLLVVDVAHLHCGQAELDGLLTTLLQYGVHTFDANNGHWIEPGGRRWMALPGYDEEA